MPALGGALYLSSVISLLALPSRKHSTLPYTALGANPFHMGHQDSASMTERIIWTLALATAGALATAVATKAMTLVWRKARGTDPPDGVPGVGMLGTGFGKKAAQRLL